MARIIKFILSEDLASDTEDLVDKLRKAYGVKPRAIRELWKKSGENYQAFNKLLKDLEDQKSGEQIEPGEDIKLLDYEELGRNLEAPDQEEIIKDEAIIDVLKYLANLWRNKDRVRVLAARFGIDPEIYQAAGLGNLPDDYDDKDVWNTMDKSNMGTEQFKQSVWQPFYIDTLEKLKELPDDIKDEIADKIAMKKNVHFPVRSDRSYNDTGMAFEGVLLDDLIIDDNNSMFIISKGENIVVVK